MSGTWEPPWVSRRPLLLSRMESDKQDPRQAGHSEFHKEDHETTRSCESVRTGGLRSRKAAIREPGNPGKHEVGRQATNRVENSHPPCRRRERSTLRFWQIKTQQKPSFVHAVLHNRFTKDGHLIGRDNCKAQRSAALAEWKTRRVRSAPPAQSALSGDKLSLD